MKRNLRELTMRNLTADLLKALLTLSLIFSFHVPDVAAFGISHGSDDDGDSDDDDGGSSRTRRDNRSGNVSSCERFVGLSWQQIVKSAGSENTYLGISSVQGRLKEVFPEQMREVFDIGDPVSGPEHGLTDVKVTKIARAVSHLAYCEAYAATLDPKNYTDNRDDFEETESKPSMGAHGLPCLNQPTAAAKQQCMMQAQMKEPLKCVNKKYETHDYRACKRILNFIDGFAIGKQVMQMQQGYRAGAHQIDLQQDYLKKANSGEAGVTDAMAVQRDSLEKQASLAYEMAAFDAAKAATLLTMINNVPRPGKFIEEECSRNVMPPNNIKTQINGILPDILTALIGAEAQPKLLTAVQAKLELPDVADTLCENAIGTANGENYIFMSSNQEVFDEVKGLAIKAGLEALANGAKGAILNKQADMIDDAMKDVQEFEPPEFPVAEAMEATASECLVDPNAEGCIAPNGAGFDGFRDQGFSATVGGSANLGSDLGRGSVDDNDSGINGASGPDRSLIPNDFGVVQQAGESDNSFSDGTARAGSIKAGELAAGGGAGGGGAGGGGGGLGGGPARGPANKKAPSGKKDIKIKTSGNGLGVVGGRGRIGARKKQKASNPFSKLLGKNKKGRNGTLNFRGPAQLGGKKGSLFKMISDRYNVVQSKDRLLKYEAER